MATNVFKRIESVQPDALLRLWAAESGRCQVCGRAMDRALADAWPTPIPFDGPEDLARFQLVCPLCAHHIGQFVWSTPHIQPHVLAKLTQFLATPPASDTLADTLQDWLQSTGILVPPMTFDWCIHPSSRFRLWLPGIGVFKIGHYGNGALSVMSFKPHNRGPHALTAVGDPGIHRRALQPTGKPRPPAE